MRHFERQYADAPDAKLLDLSMALRGKARGKWDLDGLLPEAFGLVSSGQADYMVYSLYAGKDFLKKAAATARFETLPKFISEENFYIVVSKRSRYVGLLPRINAEIARRKADGTITALIAQFSN